MSIPEPIKRTEQYYAYLAGKASQYPGKPITREEQYLHYLCENGGLGGGVTPEQIEAAVNKYLEKNPVTPVDISVQGNKILVAQKGSET